MSTRPFQTATYKVFVSARHCERARAADFAGRLCDGAKCCTGWFLNEKDDDQLDRIEKINLAMQAYRAVHACHYFVHLHYCGSQRGGNLVELGMALAWGKSVIVVCPALVGRSIFHELPMVHMVGRDEEALDLINRWVHRRRDPRPEARGIATPGIATPLVGAVLREQRLRKERQS